MVLSPHKKKQVVISTHHFLATWPPLGAQSERNTVPASAAATGVNALQGLSQVGKILPASDAPITPAHRIRRANTPTLPGSVGDVPLLQPGDTALDTKSTAPSVGNTPGTLKTKKKKKSTKAKRPVATPMAGTTPPAVVGSTENPVVPKKAAKKSAAKPPHVETDPPIVKLEKVKTPKTPPTVRETRNVSAAAEQNMARATTRDQLAPSPAVPKAAPIAHHEPSDDDDGDDENPTDIDDVSDDAESNEEPEEEESEHEAAKELPKDDSKVKGKGKKEKTPEQKAAAARYMRFSRSLVSFLSTALALYIYIIYMILILYCTYYDLFETFWLTRFTVIVLVFFVPMLAIYLSPVW